MSENIKVQLNHRTVIQSLFWLFDCFDGNGRIQGRTAKQEHKQLTTRTNDCGIENNSKPIQSTTIFFFVITISNRVESLVMCLDVLRNAHNRQV